MLNIGGKLELWVGDGDNRKTFVVVVIMIKYIVGHMFKKSYNLPSLTPRKFSHVALYEGAL